MVIKVVYLSNREMKILRLMTQKLEGVSLEDLMRILEVSKRTVYRELAGLEDTIKAFDLELNKEGKFYRLLGEQAGFLKLEHHLKSPLAIEWIDVVKRQIAIFTTIALQTEAKYTQTDLADIFAVSQTTIQQDLSSLNEVISKYNILVDSTKDHLLYVSGNEVYIRLYLSQVLSSEINEFDFFQALSNHSADSIETESQYLLDLIDQETMQMVYRALEQAQPEIVEKIADDILMNFVLMMTISLMRLERGAHINTAYPTDYNKLFPYMQQVLAIVKVFETSYKSMLNMTELSFFAMQLRGMNVRKSHSIFQQTYDMELAFNIKYLIKLVSNEFKFNFNMDSVLYHDLINHIGAALKRLELLLPEMENSVLTKLKQEYSTLYAIVEEKLIEVFSPAIFSEQEIGFVVTHFASSYEQHGRRTNLRVLVVCASGIGTSKILKTRLERSIPEIENIDVVRAIDLKEVDVSSYEIVFSTIVLSGFDYEYSLIDPILDEQEIKTIKERLRKHPKAKINNPIKSTPKIPLTVSFDKVKQLVKIVDRVVEEFKVIAVEQSFESIAHYIDFTFEENFTIKEKINQRLKSSPLGYSRYGNYVASYDG